ncbi:MAG: tRNA 2-thiouridine(34) synthase MnmA [Lachnospiraceae bacterium]|nr:tRNA 2-thiouridine(34) synthase MnmA [Lachnospiraceae bacterium]
MSKVIVGMSGGVDSAVTAYLLKNEGYDVIGVTLRTWISDNGEDSRCCEIDDARRVCEKIGIPYHTFNCISEFNREVTEPFVDEYLRGRTPNPCILCNRYVKWEKMLYTANVMGADHVATGHYASIVRLDNGRYTVKKAVHDKKDQTYMLYRLTQEQLAKTMMPLGKYTKEEVRSIAVKGGLPVAAKEDSQEICFVTDGSYSDFVEKNAKAKIPGEGLFVDEDGNVLGKHRGIIHYTVGQRKGLGMPLGYPAYVKKILTDTNDIVIGKEDSIYSKELILNDIVFMGMSGLDMGEELSCKVKVRYHHREQAAKIFRIDNDNIKVMFEEPVKGASPGQSAVFYDSDGCVICGGVIAEVIY